MADPSFRAFLRRLEQDGVIELDLRATLALERLLADGPYEPDELCDAVASVLARDAAEWRALHERLELFLREPTVFLTGEGATYQPAAVTPNTSVQTEVHLAPPTSTVGRRQHRRMSVRAWRERTVQRLINLPRGLWAAILAAVALLGALGLVLATTLLARCAALEFTATDPPAELLTPVSPTPDLPTETAERSPDPIPHPPSEHPADSTPEFTRNTPAPDPEQTVDPSVTAAITIDPSLSLIPASAAPLLSLAAEPRPAVRHAVFFALWLVSLLLAAIGVRLLATPQVYRRVREDQRAEALRLRAREAEDDADPVLTYAVERYEPLPLAAIDDAATLLGRLTEPTLGDDLDVDATLDATLRAAGRFSPVCLPSTRPQHLTVLVDVESGAHPYLHAAVYVLARWQRQGVRLVRFDFQFRPTRVQPRPVALTEEEAAPWTELTPLEHFARRAEGAPLLIVSRMTDLAERGGGMTWLRHLDAWPVCAILDLDPRPLGERGGEAARVVARLRDAGVARFPFTVAGLRALATHLVAGTGLPAPEPELPPYTALTASIERWAALVACVPDPTWVQLEAFRREFSAEIGRDLPEPRHIQRLLDWLTAQGIQPISGDGRRLVLPAERVTELIEKLRIEDPERSAERRARALIVRQLQAATPRSRPIQSKRALRIAFHQAVIAPERADELLSPFLGSAVEDELRQILRDHMQRTDPTAWQTLQDRAVAAGSVPLRHLLARPWWRSDARGRHALAAMGVTLTWATAWPWGLDWYTSLGLMVGLGATSVSILPLGLYVRARFAASSLKATPPRPGAPDDPPTGSPLGPGRAALVGVAELQLVRLSGGAFSMGSRKGEGHDDERPRHRVVVSTFEIGMHPVTVAQWEEVIGAAPDGNLSVRHPIVNVSWADVLVFLNRLSEREGMQPCYTIEGNQVRWHAERDGYRLPTEAEWEYAARAGTTTAHSFGDDLTHLDDYAWYSDNTHHLQRVGRKRPNPWGLCDVHGNVWEWVWDKYGPYNSEEVWDPTGFDVNGPVMCDDNDDNTRVLRGGSFLDGAELLRSAYRIAVRPTNRNSLCGFRVARGPRFQA